ncbi:MAG: hypothetical protein FWG98_00030 [Candidatus Cloacimonetes bacterium]|nr:hypothetical protein [Candidatus Cloacimonadota bacterium]
MKRILIFTFFAIFFIKLSSSELIHAYWGNYVDIVRIVFVMRTGVHYSTLMDTDNKVIHIHINDARLSGSILPVNFSETPLIDRVTYETSGRDLRISIHTNVVYYAESFFLREENFKIVVDVFRQREPSTMQQALEYLNFFQTVGYHDRAARLQRRIQNNEFETAVITRVVDPPPPPPTQQHDLDTTTQQTQTSSFDRLGVVLLDRDDVLLYLKPDVTFLNINQQNWVNGAFRIYDAFINLHINLEQVERTLELYDSQRIVDITFIETMSLSSNILSDANIRINEIRLQFQNSLSRIPQSNEAAIRYTGDMIQHILGMLDSYQNKVSILQSEIERRVRS